MRTIVIWTNEHVVKAYRALLTFLHAGTPRDGLTGYKAGQLLVQLTPMYAGIETQGKEIVERFQKVVQGHKLPATQDGRAVPPEIWATDPQAFHAADRELMEYSQSITFEHRFSVEELARQVNMPGGMWTELTALIDQPVAPAASEVPTPIEDRMTGNGARRPTRRAKS